MNEGWLQCSRPRARPRVRLVCAAHAGGAASMFAGWHQYLPEDVETWGVQLPGREDRLLDPPVDSVAAMVGALGPPVATLGTDTEVVLLGNCFGAVVMYELARWLRERDGGGPARFIAAAHPGPTGMDPPADPPVHTLPDRAVLASVGDAAGTDPQLLTDPEILELILPALRADARAHETYEYRPGTPLDFDLLALAGETDSGVSPESLRMWSRETTGECTTRLLPGGHFFLKTHPAEALSVIADWLSPGTGSRS